MIIKEVVIGMTSILQHKGLQVREDTIISEDGVELSRTYMRYVLAPGDDVSERPEFIRNLTAFLWTQEVLDAFAIEHAKLRAATLPGGNPSSSGGTIREQGTTPDGIQSSDAPDRGNG